MDTRNRGGLSRWYRYYQNIVLATNTSKFWSIQVEAVPPSARVWWGRIGSTPQSQSWNFTTPEQADRWADGRIQEKLRIGYDPVAPADSPPPGKSVMPGKSPDWRANAPEPTPRSIQTKREFNFDDED